MTEYTYDDDSFSDIYKDTYGYRPWYSEYFTADSDTKQKIWDNLILEHAKEMEAYDISQKEAIKSFNNRINELIEKGDEDKIAAFRWLIDIEDDNLLRP